MNISTDITPANAVSLLRAGNAAVVPTRHLLGIEGMNPLEIRSLLDRGDQFANAMQQSGDDLSPLSDVLRGKTIINLFYENSTRTRVSFELAAKRLGGAVLNIAVAG